MTKSEKGARDLSMSDTSDPSPLRVLIVGGGIAALEAALALDELAGELTERTVVAPNDEFVLRAWSVREPFSEPAANRWPLDDILAAANARRVVDELESVDATGRSVLLRSGTTLDYDALILAVGARPVARYEHAATIDDASMYATLGGLVRDVEEGYVDSVAFVSPPRIAWPLPLYELALLTAARAYEMGAEVRPSIVTPEEAPLAIFGRESSEVVRGLLADAGIEVICSAYAEVPRSGEVVVSPGERVLHAARIVALPELMGPSIAGLPEAANGFLKIDQHARVPETEGVYAAGDAVDFAVKHGAVGAQQADAAAEDVAALAGAAIEPQAFRPVISGMLLTGGHPLFMEADIAGGSGSAPAAYRAPAAESGKLVTRFLTPALERLSATR
ncbi:MAG TPA: FAD-dependent oxidoreductase [Solirubrobacteraceae bacterium]|nr:FAD-dependent oxidoreductase [Solirubrobacteraceae bacterium]